MLVVPEKRIARTQISTWGAAVACGGATRT